MNRALLIIAVPAAAGVALWGGAVLGYRAGITLAALLIIAAALTFLIYRRKPTAPSKSAGAGSSGTGGG